MINIPEVKKFFSMVDSKTGKNYTSIDDLPPELRAKLENKLGSLNDANADGIPDAIEQRIPEGTSGIQMNGQQYSSFDQMPPEAKQKLQQAFGGANPFGDQNVWMNFLKNGTHVQKNNAFRMNVNGKTYNSLNELPEEMREEMKQAFSALEDSNNDGVPDMLEGGIIRFLRGLSQLRPGALLRNQVRQFKKNIEADQPGSPIHQPSAGKKGEPIQLAKTGEDRSEKWRIVLIVLVVLGAGVYFGWEWIVEFVGGLESFID